MSSCTKKTEAGGPTPCCGASTGTATACSDGPLSHFDGMIESCLAHAKDAKEQGRPIVGIMCEYTPRELVLAAGAVPVCLCGGSQGTIAPAEEHLPTNLCPLIKSTYGYEVTRSNPFVEMADLIVAETTCDGKKKMYELMAERRPMHVLELPQMPSSEEGLALWTEELRKLRRVLEERFAVTITDGALKDAICTMNRERSLRRGLAALMKGDKPPLTGRQLLNLKSSISAIPGDLQKYQEILDQLSKAEGVVDAGQRVRVLLTGVPIVHGAERVLDIIEDRGGLVVCMESCTGLKPILDDVDEGAPDPMGALAEKYFHLPCSVMTPNDARLEVLTRLAREYRAECIIDLAWQACLTYDVEAHRVRRLAQEALGLPHLHIETDYSPSDSARIAVRVEALFETVHRNTPANTY